MTHRTQGIAISFVTAALLAFRGPATGEERVGWPRHTIDDSSRGADGVRLADVNGDGKPDITTGWEEGGRVRVTLNPGPERARDRWPAVTVGEVGDVEDAAFVDLDGDGATDVASCCEGKTRGIFVHWAPKGTGQYLSAAAWRTEALPAAQGTQWMFSQPLQVDGRGGVDLVAGAKNARAEVGWFEAPPDPRRLADWKWHPWCAAGWIVSLIAADMDGDGDTDVLVSDRKGPTRGVFWLRNPGAERALAAPWERVEIGGGDREVMFLTLADLDRDGLQDVIAAAKPQEALFFRRRAPDGRAWEPHPIPFPENTGSAKAVAVGDVDLDGRPDLVFTCEEATGDRSGVMRLSYRSSPLDPAWDAHPVGGIDGVKHDLVQLLDLDADGDPDVLTCEERKNLGVFWYENPARKPR